MPSVPRGNSSPRRAGPRTGGRKENARAVVCGFRLLIGRSALQSAPCCSSGFSQGSLLPGEFLLRELLSGSAQPQGAKNQDLVYRQSLVSSRHKATQRADDAWALTLAAWTHLPSLSVSLCPSLWSGHSARSKSQVSGGETNGQGRECAWVQLSCSCHSQREGRAGQLLLVSSVRGPQHRWPRRVRPRGCRSVGGTRGRERLSH